jgi:hypothetical protein
VDAGAVVRRAIMSVCDSTPITTASTMVSMGSPTRPRWNFCRCRASSCGCDLAAVTLRDSSLASRHPASAISSGSANQLGKNGVSVLANCGFVPWPYRWR